MSGAIPLRPYMPLWSVQRQLYLSIFGYRDIWYMIWYDMIWYNMIWYDTIRYDTIRYDTIRYDTIYLIAVGLTPGGSTRVHICTEKLRQTPIRTVHIWVEIWTRQLPYTKQKCYPVCYRVLSQKWNAWYNTFTCESRENTCSPAVTATSRTDNTQSGGLSHTHIRSQTDCECWFKPTVLLHKTYRALNKWRHKIVHKEPSLSTNQHQRSRLTVFHP
jgi:hypothetical protein